MATPFIIAIFAIIFVCLIIALIVASFLRANSAAEDDESVLQSDPQAPANNSAFEHGTAPLPPFQPIPTYTQPLSEIYYYDDPVSSSQPLSPTVPSALHTSPVSPPSPTGQPSAVPTPERLADDAPD